MVVCYIVCVVDCVSVSSLLNCVINLKYSRNVSV